MENSARLKNLKPDVKLQLCNMFSNSAFRTFGKYYDIGVCESFAAINPSPIVQPEAEPQQQLNYKDTSVVARDNESAVKCSAINSTNSRCQ